MLLPYIDPIAISIGPINIAWYGLSYALAFVVSYKLAIPKSQRPWSPIKQSQVEDLIVYGAFGVLLGGRLGYMIFYSLDRWMADPIEVFRLWNGGMSFHGGLLGVTLAILIFSRKHKIPFLGLADFVAPLIPTGLLFGRLANFVNQELYGRATDVPWAVIFPNDPERLPRHPSQLYEAMLEGLILFIVINWYARKPRLYGEVAGLFLVLYGIFRFSIEFVRQPDAHLAGATVVFESFTWMTRGQTLCIPMIMLGIWFMRKSLASVSLRSGDRV
ncbi:MAG: prolipoprotein diacylglyceryl transferase [Porticoccaceae bacterium]|nr:prolipoprotein diacylglyceryl transferase [Porticoccaceae bacterium]